MGLQSAGHIEHGQTVGPVACLHPDIRRLYFNLRLWVSRAVKTANQQSQCQTTGRTTDGSDIIWIKQNSKQFAIARWFECDVGEGNSFAHGG